MLMVIKNNWKRMLQRKLQCLVSLLLTLGAIIMAVILSHQGHIEGNVAVVGEYNELLKLPHYKVTYLDKEPPRSALVKGEYEAIIVFLQEGKYEVKSIQSKEKQTHLKKFIEKPLVDEASIGEVKQIGTTILGYMMMFLMMQAMNYGRLFAEDKDKHLLERIVVSPISRLGYIVGHGTFTGLCVLSSPLCMIGVLKGLGIETGFSMISYLLLIGMLTLLSTSVALGLYSFTKGADRANMIGSAIVIVTSLLTGCFSSDVGLEQGISKLLYLLPQKSLLFFSQSMENSNMNMVSFLSALYVILFSVALMMISILKLKKDYRYKKCPR